MQVTMTVNGERGHPRDRGPAAAGALPARPARPDRHPLGLRHQQLRHLRGLARRRAGEVVHGAGRDGRRARGAHRRGPRAGRRARPGPAGLHGVPRPAVRLLHAGHDDDRPGPARPQPRPDASEIREAISGQICRCTGYATIVRSVQWAADHERGRTGRRPRDAAERRRPGARRRPSRTIAPSTTTTTAAGRVRPDAAQGGPALRPRPGPLRRRRPAARHAAPGDPALAVRARADRQHRHQRRRGPPEGQGRRHRGRRWPSGGWPGCRRCPTTCRRCWPPTRSASRDRRSPSSSPRTGTRPATRSS